MSQLTKKLRLFTIGFLATVGLINTTQAAIYHINPGSDVVGESFIVPAHFGDTLLSIGMGYGMGYNEMVIANPHIRPGSRIHRGTQVVIPSSFVLPQVRQGLVINLSELRVYYFNGGTVYTYPVGLGRAGWGTPITTTKVISHVPYPDWRPTDSIKAYARATYGIELPDVEPGGYPLNPRNPLGVRALYLGNGDLRMHGTNEPASIGTFASSGCIRMFNEHVMQLYSVVPDGARVTIMNEVYKFGNRGGLLYLEAHQPADAPITHNAVAIYPALSSGSINLNGHTYRIDPSLLNRAAGTKQGFPKAIGRMIS